MNTDGIIDPDALARIRKENQEKVEFEQLKESILAQICRDWKRTGPIQRTVQNKYYQFDYIVEDCYNRTGNRTLKFLHTGTTIHDHNYYDISYRIKQILG